MADRNNVCDSEKVLYLAGLAARAVLESGGETYRVEETALHIFRASGFKNCDALSNLTGFSLTLFDGEQRHTSIVRVQSRTIDLARLDFANALSRRYCNGELTIDEAVYQYKHYQRSAYPKVVVLFCAGVASALFATLYSDGSNIYNLFGGFLCGIMVQAFALFFGGVGMANFVVCLFGALVSTMLAFASNQIIPSIDIEMVITGAIMPILPGLAITNAVRDTMNGDLDAGVARATEGLAIAGAIAGGVVLGFKIMHLIY